MAPSRSIPHRQCKSLANAPMDGQPLAFRSRRNAGTSSGLHSLPSPASSVTLHSGSDPELPADSNACKEFYSVLSRVTELLEQELKTARKEILKLKRENRKAEDLGSKANAKLAVLHSTITNFKVSRDAATQCSVCNLPMSHPFILRGCGHIFCHACLRSWFHTCLSRQIQNRSIPAHLKHPPPYTADDITELFSEQHLYVPLYNCPMCRAPVRERPLDVLTFRELIQATYLSFGHPKEATAEVVHADDEGLWADVFYQQN